MRRRTAIDRLFGLIEEGIMKPRDPEFAQRLSENRQAVSAISSRIDVLESQLARGSRKSLQPSSRSSRSSLRPSCAMRTARCGSPIYGCSSPRSRSQRSGSRLQARDQCWSAV
jgi:hypothetical protein